MEAHAVELVPSGQIIDCAAYAGGMRVADLSLDDIQHALTKPDTVVWLGLFEPSQELLQKVQRQFRLHDLAVEDAYAAHQRPKLEQYEDSLFVVLRTAQMTGPEHRLELGETHVFVGRNYVVT